MPGQGAAEEEGRGPKLAGSFTKFMCPTPTHPRAPHPHTSLRASSVFPPVTGLEPCQGGEGIKAQGQPRPHRGAGTSLPACPAVCGHRSALARATSDRWAACYLLDSVLSRLGRGEGGHIPEAESPSHPEVGGKGEQGAGRSPLRVRGPRPGLHE